jgi:gamma-glutamyltranspeptidase / glutathione hydrolase
MLRHFRTPLLLVALAYGCAAPRPSAERVAAVAESDAGVPSSTGMVVSTSDIASDVGAAILRRGGNAVDAAVATAFALAVTHPSAGNIGGGGFMVVRPPSGEPITIDYREKAPLASTTTMYLDSAGNIDRSLTAAGYLAPGVPGTVRGMEMAHRQFGSLPWSDLVMPAAELAERGFILSESLSRSINNQLAGAMGRFPSSVAAYGKPGGGAWAAGDRIVLTDLGRSLRAIATQGPDAFYTGWIADSLAADMERNGGIITRADLEAYEARLRPPVRGSYRGYEIISMPPPSSGGIALIQMLNMMEEFDLESKGRFSASTLHLLIEARRHAFLDRARHVGDPDFVQVPIARLTSKEYARTLARRIDTTRAGNSLELGRDIVTVADSESTETTHFSVIDRNGLAVSNTYTLEGGYGSRAVVRGAGFILNNEMGDFNRKPGTTNTTGDIGTPANIIAPGKRMLSSMTPTIVARDGKVVLITGSPGGRTIINTVFDVVLNVTEFGMNAREAVDAPRLHHQWLPDVATLEAGAVPEATLEILRAMGHNIRMQGRQGDAHTIYVDPATGMAWGANDRRTADSKVSR